MNHKCIAVASMDRDYADPAKVFIYSFKQHHPDIPINIYVLDDYTPDQDILDRYPDVKFIPFKAEKCRKFINDNINGINNISFANNVYDSSKIIDMLAYIEAIDELIVTKQYDVIIKSDLDTLWCGNIENDLNAFVESKLPIAMSRERVNIKHFMLSEEGLHYQYLNTGGYFCAGITLYNARVLSAYVFRTIIKTIMHYGINRFHYLDQDGLSISYSNKFVLNGVYNITSLPIPDAKNVYVLHYNADIKPFAIVTKDVFDYVPLFRTYELYREIAKTIECDSTFITKINNSIAEIKKRLVHVKEIDSGIQLIQIKCAEMLRKFKELV